MGTVRINMLTASTETTSTQSAITAMPHMGTQTLRMENTTPLTVVTPRRVIKQHIGITW